MRTRYSSILLLFSHPAYQRSRVNRALVEAVSDLEGVTFHDLYECYPDFMIDDAHERQLLREHDVIVTQHPFYWYSCPALFKQWQDLVLTHGFAYGEGGTALQGKRWLSAVTTGAPAAAYTEQGRNRFPAEQLLLPFAATAHLCGCVWESPFIVNGAHRISAEALSSEAERYRARLIGLRDQQPGAAHG